MKKSIFIIAIFIMALMSTNASAQTSNLIGAWVGDSEIINDNDMNGYVTPVITLKENNVGSFSFYYSATCVIDNQTSIEVTLAGNVPGTWSYSNNTLTMDINKSAFCMNISDKCFKIKSTDPEIRNDISTYKAALTEGLQEIKTIIYDALPYSITWTNVTMSNGKLFLTDSSGNVIKYTRGKSNAKQNNSTTKKSKNQKRK